LALLGFAADPRIDRPAERGSHLRHFGWPVGSAGSGCKVPEAAKSDLAALQNALDALNALQVAIQLVREHLAAVQRQLGTWDWELNFDLYGKFIGVSRKRNAGELEYPADSIYCIDIQSHCEWLPKYVDSLWEAQPKVDGALRELPSRLTDKLDALTQSPWVASVRRHCVDKVLAWPGEMHHQTSLAAEKVHGRITELLDKAAKYDPFPTWKQFEELIAGYKSDLIAIRDILEFPKLKVDVHKAAENSEQNQENANRLFQGEVPDDHDLVSLAVRLDAERDSGKTKAAIAREVTKEPLKKDPRARKLLARIRMMERRGKLKF